MIRALIIQLFSRSLSVPTCLQSLFNSCGDGTREASIGELEGLLSSLINSHQRTFIVLDALDECEDRQDLLNFLESAIKRQSEKLNVIRTSRKLKDIQDLFDFELNEESQLFIQNEKVDKDVGSFVRWKLQNDRRFRRWQNWAGVQQEIEGRLIEKCDGI